MEDGRVWSDRTQQELAAAAGIPLPTYAEIEAGRYRRCSAAIRERLAATLTLDPATLAAALERQRRRRAR